MTRHLNGWGSYMVRFIAIGLLVSVIGHMMGWW